ncbi:hypothetical protein TruAng_011988 [Truncatella angustata]|nr:hypothetical protein TruAng_011988 [Truncatella angustata]
MTDPKKLRDRKTNSCISCVQQKRQCNREHPCQQCIKRDKPRECVYQPHRPVLISRSRDKPGFQNYLSQLEQQSYSPGKQLGSPNVPNIYQEHGAELEHYVRHLVSMSVTDGEDIVELILPKLLQTGDLVTSILFERSIVQECWQHSDPDRPGQYKVEAAIVRLAVTVYHQSDLQRAYTALGHAIALAESSGYREFEVLHPSDFKGELRRRAWLLLENFDYRICSSFGRVQRISHKQRKLELRNLSDTSFDAYSTELPLQRRLDQLTRVLPIILISAIRNVSAKITLDIFGRDDITSKDIQDFDQELDAVYQRVPKTITGDPVKVLQLQYTIAIIYHAAKIVLHRWSVLDENMDRSDPYANHSRGQCIGSAVEIMKIQKSLLDNRRSHHNRWELDPLTMKLRVTQHRLATMRSHISTDLAEMASRLLKAASAILGFLLGRGYGRRAAGAAGPYKFRLLSRVLARQPARASASDDQTVRIWDAVTGLERHALKGHTDDVNSVAFSYDGRLVASASDDETVRIWDAVTGAERQVLQTGYVHDLHFDLGGKQLLTDKGAFSIAPLEKDMPDQDYSDVLHDHATRDALVSARQPESYGISQDSRWIMFGEKSVLWLPPEYRSGRSAISGDTIVIGCQNGKVLIMCFKQSLYFLSLCEGGSPLLTFSKHELRNSSGIF